jgi:hypothetical protein
MQFTREVPIFRRNLLPVSQGRRVSGIRNNSQRGYAAKVDKWEWCKCTENCAYCDGQPHITLHSLVAEYEHFRGTYCLHLQGRHKML